MCSHYQAIKERERYLRYFGVPPPGDLGKVDLWPGYLGVFIRRHPHADVGDEVVPPCEALTGLFGLVPHWSLDTRITKHTFNARSETVAVKPSFREAWKHGQHCVVPADAFFEPDWRSGRAIPTKITRADGEPLGIAGLWSWWGLPRPRSEMTALRVLVVCIGPLKAANLMLPVSNPGGCHALSTIGPDRPLCF